MIRTVLGDIPAPQLGRTHAHDHVLIADSLGTRGDPDLTIDDVERAVAEVRDFQRAGGGALVDAMPLDSGRDPAGLVAVSRRTGVHIVATTGFHTPRYYEQSHWSGTLPQEKVVELLCAEVQLGMDARSYSGPVVERLSARAGLVKAATGPDGLDPRSRRCFALAAECHRRTGAPVLTHTEHGLLGLEQVALLVDLGVPADAVLVSHVDRNHDPAYHTDLSQTGAYLVYDGVSRTKYHAPDVPVKLIAAACSAGAAQRVLLGLDLARRSYRSSYGGRPGLAYLLTDFVPILLAHGFAATDIEDFLRVNPAAALSMRSAS